MCKVTIVVPVYNVEKYLAECLDSLIHQTLREIEIICVNDGSTDNSPNILEDYRKKDDRIKIINQKNRGLSVARNVGCDNAKGEYVYFCDSDDYLALDAMEKCYETAKIYDVDVLRFGYRIFDDDNRQNMTDLDCLNTEQVITGVEMLELVFQAYMPLISLLFIKKMYWKQNKCYFIDGIIHEDHSFFVEILIMAARAYHINVPLYYKRVRQESIMTSLRPLQSVRGMMSTIKYLEKAYSFSSLEKEKREILQKYLNYFYGFFLVNYVLLQKSEKIRIKKEVREFKEILKKSLYFHERSPRYFSYVEFLYIFYLKYIKNPWQ